VDGPNGSATSGSWNQNYDHPDATGKRTTIRSGASYGPTYNFFPASGIRDGGKLRFMGFYGYYWSGSVHGTTLAYIMEITFGEADTDTAQKLQSGCFPVRCVLQE
jgi:hypothetical protein